jgi:hypothetical protein
MDSLGEMVDNDEDGVKAIQKWKLDHEINTYAAPGIIWGLKRVQ